MVITARGSSLNESALLRLAGDVQSVELGKQLDALDLRSAPRLADFIDDDPCVRSMRDGNWSPGTSLRDRSILGRAICVQYDGSPDCPSGRLGAPKTEWFPDASIEAKQITIETSELTIPGDLFSGDVVLLVITPGKGVRPAAGPLRSVSPRLVVGQEDGRDWPRHYSDYLDAICRGAQTYLLESTADLRTWDLTFSSFPSVEDFQSFGATWYPTKGPMAECRISTCPACAFCAAPPLQIRSGSSSRNADANWSPAYGPAPMPPPATAPTVSPTGATPPTVEPRRNETASV